MLLRYLTDLWEWAAGVVTGTYRYVWRFAPADGGDGKGRLVLVSPWRLSDDELRAEHAQLVATFTPAGFVVVSSPMPKG